MKTMQELVNVLETMKYPTDGLSDGQLRELAKTLKLEAPPKERTVEIVDWKGRPYVKTEGYPVGNNTDGKPRVAKGLFLDVNAVDQAIADLQAAKSLLSQG